MSKGQGGNPSRRLDILVNPEVYGGGLGDVTKTSKHFQLGLFSSTSKMFLKQEFHGISIISDGRTSISPPNRWSYKPTLSWKLFLVPKRFTDA